MSVHDNPQEVEIRVEYVFTLTVNCQWSLFGCETGESEKYKHTTPSHSGLKEFPYPSVDNSQQLDEALSQFGYDNDGDDDDVSDFCISDETGKWSLHLY